MTEAVLWLTIFLTFPAGLIGIIVAWVDLIFVSRFWRAISDPAFLVSSSVLGDRSGVGLSSMVCSGAKVVGEVHKDKGHLTIGWSGP